MERKIITIAVLLCLCFVLSVQAQEREISLKAGYPLPIGDTFLSQYDGRAAGSVVMGQPLGERFLLQLGLQYNRLHWGRTETDANIYSPRIGLAYSIDLSDRFAIAPKAGVSYSRFVFALDVEEPEAVDRTQNGGGFWIGIRPIFRVSDRWGVGVSAEYRATFIEQPEEVADTPFNREYHALVFGLVGTYRL